MLVYLQQQDICHLICITPQLRSSPSPEVLSPFLAVSSVCSFYPIHLAAVLCRAVAHGSMARSGVGFSRWCRGTYGGLQTVVTPSVIS